MKNLAVLNGFDIKPYAFEPIGTGGHAFSRVLEYAKSLPGVERIFVLASENSPVSDCKGSVRYDIVSSGTSLTVESLMKTLASLGTDCDDLFYMYADTPFLDREITGKMYLNHGSYRAQYSFADGYPYGLTPEILRSDILPSLASLAAGNMNPTERGSVFSVLQKDINAFDIETEISPVDHRLLRLSLSCDTHAGFTLVSRLAALDAVSADDVCRLVSEKPSLLRTYPAFFNVQISGGCPQACSYCPFPSFGGDILEDRRYMPRDDFSRILDAVEAFSREAVVSVSMWGEPSLHPEIAGIIRDACSRRGLTLVVETSGIGWKRETLDAIRSLPKPPAAWIISLDAGEKSLYGKLRGEGFDEAVGSIPLFNELFPGRTFVQSVRMHENEEQLESFYKSWKNAGVQVIIQKYDHFCDRLPRKKISDLSPINRFPCWHLKRDVAVLLDGTVPLCREDVECSHVLGNILNEPLHEIWQRGERFYLEHTRDRYPEICRNCDEYYTYNF